MFFRQIILPSRFYCCENLSFTTREANVMSVFEKRVLRKPFYLKEVTVLHYDELHNLYNSPHIIRLISPGG